jgi:ABC-type uncharacterized transport system substrate-binding protein
MTRVACNSTDGGTLSFNAFAVFMLITNSKVVGCSMGRSAAFADPHSPSIAAPYHDAFRQGLRDRGYVDGQNIRIEYRWADGKDERLPDLAAELVRLQVNVMVTGGPQATRAATEATSSIPIVMVAVGADPVKMRLVASLARPGGNITGSTLLSPELSAKRLQLLKEAVPKLARVGVLWNSANPEADQRHFPLRLGDERRTQRP